MMTKPMTYLMTHLMTQPIKHRFMGEVSMATGSPLSQRGAEQ
jgi:hypothetical protein